ncbi:MAG: hypothetical protein Q7K25_09980, partial [Actinomycetota bacterium]|nr:hypothetical protein [Actinomycetota bacterium]
RTSLHQQRRSGSRLNDTTSVNQTDSNPYLVIAVLSEYSPKSSKQPLKDFRTVTNFIDTLYAAERLVLPLKGILIIGY